MRQANPTNLFQSARHLERKRKEESVYIDRIQGELEAVSSAIEAEFAVLTTIYPPGSQLPETSLDKAYETLSEKLKAMRSAGLLHGPAIEINIDFLSHIAALQIIREELLNMRQMWG